MKEHDWDHVASNYHETLLGPFLPEMVDIDPSTGKCRNLLLNAIRSAGQDLKTKRVADYGCGPGNILEFVEGIIPAISGVDISANALAIAQVKAQKHGVQFHAVESDLRNYRPEEKFDLIFSVNAILPSDRKDVVSILESISEGLSPHGQLWAIMPSYDTTEHLIQCIQKDLEDQVGSEKASAEAEHFRLSKKSDPVTCSYADDGVHVQCYHTPETMMREFEEADLTILKPLEKVYYPWELTRRYDYGFHPNHEEIWDWFVIAGKK